MLMTAAFILPPPQVGQVSDLPNLIRAGGASSSRFPNLSVPLAALALVAESKRRKGEGLTEAQRRVGQVSDLPNGADAKIDRMEAAAIAAAQEAKRNEVGEKVNWVGIIFGSVFVIVGVAMVFIGLGLGAELEPGGFFIAGAGSLLAAIGAEIVTQSLGTLRPSWWPEHILNTGTRK
ncbi:MAG: hypothetical protein Fur002_15930 [Anaerolineales bacterium]